MGIILPLMTSAFSGGNNRFHLLLPCLLQHCIAVIGTICKELVRGQIHKQFSGGYRIVYVARLRTHYFQRRQKRISMDMEVSMSTLFYLSSAQMDVIRPFFPRSRGIPRRDNQKIISELSMFSSSVSDGRMLQKNTAPIKLFITVLSDGDNRFVRWSNMGVFKKIFTALSESTQDTSLLMIDATCLKAHRTAASLRKKGFLSLYRTHKRRIEHQITCSL